MILVESRHRRIRCHLAPLAGRGRIASKDAIWVRGTRQELSAWKQPLTPTLSERASLVSAPHPPSPEGGLRRTRERGEGARFRCRSVSTQTHRALVFLQDHR